VLRRLRVGVRGVGDCFVIEKYYIKEIGRGICLHALASMLTLLRHSSRGGSGYDARHWKGGQCRLYPGEQYTCGRTVVFELKRGKVLGIG